MTNHLSPEWSEEEKATLIRMWSAGEAMAAICAAIPGRTKNAILGRSRRLQAALGPEVIAPRRPGTPRRGAETVNPPRKVRPERVQHPAPPTLPPGPCLWPLWADHEPAPRPAVYCCAPTLLRPDGKGGKRQSMWCEEHRKRGTIPEEPRRRVVA